MKFEALRTADFGKIGTAYHEWSDLVKKFDDYAEYAQDVLVGRARKARWKGVNAGVTKPFIAQTQREFNDLLTEARSIRDVFEDTKRDLKRCQDDLKDAIKAAEDEHFTVEPWGDGGFHVKKGYGPTLNDDGEYYTAKELKAVERHKKAIKKVLHEAEVLDRQTAKALRAWIKQTKVGGAGGRYTDRDTLVERYEAGVEAAEIGAKGREMTPKDFDKLDSHLKKYGKDKVFAEAFATKMTPDGVKAMWADLRYIGPDDGYSVVDKRGDGIVGLQKHLSTTLATATQSDSAAMQKWERAVVRDGMENIDLPGGRTGPSGFQVMSSLMGSGDFEDSFLKRYGEGLTTAERNAEKSGRTTSDLWRAQGQGFNLNPSGADLGSDPMTGFMKALSHSPDASTDFMNDPFESGDQGAKGENSNFHYLFKDRDWFEADGKPGRNALGDAVEAGTTGHPPGQAPTSIVHDSGQAKLMSNVVKTVAEHPTRLTEHLEMADSLGRAAREYMPDIFRGLEGSPSPTTERLYPIAGEVANFGDDGASERNLSRFLISVGQDPTGYKEIVVGQQNYADTLYRYHLDPEIQAQLPESERFEGTPGNAEDAEDRAEDVVKRITRQTGYVNGALTIGRQETLINEGLEHDAEFGTGMKRVSTWGYAGGSTATGVALAVGKVHPVANAVITGVSGGVLFIGPSEFGMDNQPNEGAQQAKITSEYWSAAKDHDRNYNVNVQSEIPGAQKYDPDEWDTWVREGSRQGFNEAVGAGRQMATELTSGDQVKNLRPEDDG
ncbi:DUF6571 family protein [Streptomyces qinglanensis]|uniref:Uncharacterized protein n=1 Tax=Streptomyces qinglanensis TaxID=943816 RepID=A0A1H9NPY6_9ACTN|nr:DUF6571 family protein [Streptomyces qinglanensis]SER37423.1 hypothetical protein SAMN05421870_101531 [Streptomyces qinglanensis]